MYVNATIIPKVHRSLFYDIFMDPDSPLSRVVFHSNLFIVIIIKKLPSLIARNNKSVVNYSGKKYKTLGEKCFRSRERIAMRVLLYVIVLH